jgi:hypothetical protein
MKTTGREISPFLNSIPQVIGSTVKTILCGQPGLVKVSGGFLLSVISGVSI